MAGQHERMKYYLSQIVPKGGIVCAVYPKGLLLRLLPEVAEEKNALIRVIGVTPEARELAASSRVVNEPIEPDVYVGEPVAFSKQGVAVLPSETEEWVRHDVVAVSVSERQIETIPAQCDAVMVRKLVSDKGIIPFEQAGLFLE